MGTIAQELTRIQTAKSDIKTSIEAKGVQVPSNALISDYNTYINQITGGGSVLVPLSVTTNGTYTPSAGVDGYSQVSVNVGLQMANFTDATDLFYSGRFFDIEDQLLQHFTGAYLYEAFGMSSTGPTQPVLNKWMKKAVQNAGENDLASFQLLMSYNTTHANTDLVVDLSDVVLSHDVNFSVLDFCSGSTAACQDLYINMDNATNSTYKLIGRTPTLGTSRFNKAYVRMWTDAANFVPGRVGYNQKFGLMVYKNVNTVDETVIFSSNFDATEVSLQCVQDSIPYYSDNIGDVVWYLPAATYNSLTQAMIDQAAQYHLTFTT